MDISSLRERRNEPVFTVGELNGYIKGLLENDRLLCAVTVKGEISNFIHHRSGHIYFTLKDDEGQIKSLMFRSSVARLKFMPENGMKVVVHGKVNIYAKDGSLQLYANHMQPDGIGALYLAYEQLKEKLLKEGLFDSWKKRPIPKIPRAIGIVTSPTGAALRDILNILERRFPLAMVYVYPALVQGAGAEEELVLGIDYFDKSRLVDVIIIGRGGGSIEDLWAFNSEKLARRINSATVPVISAVGHETDFTICDFVSDLRAPTPSAAAELASFDIRELYLRIDSLSDRSAELFVRTCAQKRLAFEKAKLSISKEGCNIFIKNQRKSVADIKELVNRIICDIISNNKSRLALASQKANSLSPLATLQRGYSIAMSSGAVIKNVQNIKVGDSLDICFYDGKTTARIEYLERGKLYEKQAEL